MTTDKSKLIKDIKCIPSPVFYIFAAVALFSAFFVLGFSLKSVLIAIFLLGLVACAASDINKGIVPDLIVILIAATGVINTVFDRSDLPGHLLGIVIVSVPMLLISLMVKGAFGGGDIKLMAAAGLFLGWKYTLLGAFAGMFISGFYGMYLLLTKKAGASAKLKLVPFLAFGLGAVSLFGDMILFILGFDY